MPRNKKTTAPIIADQSTLNRAAKEISEDTDIPYEEALAEITELAEDFEAAQQEATENFLTAVGDVIDEIDEEEDAEDEDETETEEETDSEASGQVGKNGRQLIYDYPPDIFGDPAAMQKFRRQQRALKRKGSNAAAAVANPKEGRKTAAGRKAIVASATACDRCGERDADPMSWVYDPTLQKNILVHDVTCTQDYDEAPKSPSELKLAAAEANANLQEEVA